MRKIICKRENVLFLYNNPVEESIGYTIQNARKGELGTVIGSFWVKLDSGIMIHFMGNDFIDPDERFAELFEFVENTGRSWIYS